MAVPRPGASSGCGLHPEVRRRASREGDTLSFDSSCAPDVSQAQDAGPASAGAPRPPSEVLPFLPGRLPRAIFPHRPPGAGQRSRPPPNGLQRPRPASDGGSPRPAVGRLLFQPPAP